MLDIAIGARDDFYAVGGSVGVGGSVLDIAIGARDDFYDVAVVASANTDLIPAIEVALRGGKRVETATWSSRALRTKPLIATGWRIWNHWLDRQRFEYVRDDTDYLAA